jgi:hypothetical protein
MVKTFFSHLTLNEGHLAAVGVCVMMTTPCPLLLRKMQGKLSFLHINKCHVVGHTKCTYMYGSAYKY